MVLEMSGVVSFTRCFAKIVGFWIFISNPTCSRCNFDEVVKFTGVLVRPTECLRKNSTLLRDNTLRRTGLARRFRLLLHHFSVACIASIQNKSVSQVTGSISSKYRSFSSHEIIIAEMQVLVVRAVDVQLQSSVLFVSTREAPQLW